MRIKMLKDFRDKKPGGGLSYYGRGSTYPMDEETAKRILASGVAVAIEESTPAPKHIKIVEDKIISKPKPRRRGAKEELTNA